MQGKKRWTLRGSRVSRQDEKGPWVTSWRDTKCIPSFIRSSFDIISAIHSRRRPCVSSLSAEVSHPASHLDPANLGSSALTGAALGGGGLARDGLGR